MNKVIVHLFILVSFLFSAPVSLSDIEKMASNFINQKTFEIKDHYFKTHPYINPSGIVPVGPNIEELLSN